MHSFNYTVYVHITPNNKFYIGITSNKPNLRWQNGKGYKLNEYFNNAINKYGWNNIKHDIIANNLTKQEAENFEILLINKLRSNDEQYGYNIKIGGNTATHSEETKLKMSKNHADFTGEKNPMSRRIMCVNTGEIFFTKREASEKHNTSQNAIFQCCNNKLLSAGKDENNKKLRWIYHDKIQEELTLRRIYLYNTGHYRL